jgi:hypothetical protein
MGTRIIFNGQHYDSRDAMPPSVREAYDYAMTLVAKTNRGAPARALDDGAVRHEIEVQHMSFTIDGKTYTNPDDMPADVRKVYQQAMAKIDGDRNGVPDAFERPDQRVASRLDATRYSFTVGSGAMTRGSGSGRSGSNTSTLLIYAVLGAALATLLFWWWQRSG